MVTHERQPAMVPQSVLISVCFKARFGLHEDSGPGHNFGNRQGGVDDADKN
jgi:hypothetical protein